LNGGLKPNIFVVPDAWLPDNIIEEVIRLPLLAISLDKGVISLLISLNL